MCRQRPRAAHLAAGRPEGSGQTEATRAIVAPRRLVHPLRPERRNHVWSYDFVEARIHEGRSLRLLTLIDEFTRECLAIRVARRFNSFHVIENLGECMLSHGVPEHVRSDNELNASDFFGRGRTRRIDRVRARSAADGPSEGLRFPGASTLPGPRST